MQFFKMQLCYEHGMNLSSKERLQNQMIKLYSMNVLL